MSKFFRFDLKEVGDISIGELKIENLPAANVEAIFHHYRLFISPYWVAELYGRYDRKKIEHILFHRDYKELLPRTGEIVVIVDGELVKKESTYLVQCEECGFEGRITSTELKKTEDADKAHHNESSDCGNLSLKIIRGIINPKKGTEYREMQSVSNFFLAV